MQWFRIKSKKKIFDALLFYFFYRGSDCLVLIYPMVDGGAKMGITRCLDKGLFDYKEKEYQNLINFLNEKENMESYLEWTDLALTICNALFGAANIYLYNVNKRNEKNARVRVVDKNTKRDAVKLNARVIPHRQSIYEL